MTKKERKVFKTVGEKPSRRVFITWNIFPFKTYSLNNVMVLPSLVYNFFGSLTNFYAMLIENFTDERNVHGKCV